MKPSVVFMFSGQGSQYYGMARALFQNNAGFRKTVDRLDACAADVIGESVIGRLYEARKSSREEFKRTLYTHPAIFIIEYTLARMLIDSGVQPCYALGVSLGEFAAAAVAGILSAEDALAAVLVQARIIEEECPSGGMLAILHETALYDTVPLLREGTELVSVNSASHFVVAGGEAALDAVSDFLRARNLNFQRLSVSHAFHSPLIDPASSRYREYLAEMRPNPPAVSFVSCLEGKVISKMDPGHFWEVARGPIRFRETMREMEALGPFLYLDAGPGSTLANLSAKNFRQGSGSESLAIVTPFHQDLKNLDTVLKKTNAKSARAKRRATMTTFLFPGQGSQQKGMGGKLFDEFPEITAKADEILGYSIRELCLTDPKRQLSQTQFTQPALYTVNALSYLKKVQEMGRKPDYVVGHSLGEYNALFAAGVFYFETGLELVKKRGELMSLATGGGMAAVIGMSAEKIEEVLRTNGIDAIDVANLNAPTQTVLAGQKSEIARIAGFFEQPGVMYFPLNVSGAFHSRYMEPSAKEFEGFIDRFRFSPPAIPVISNVHARPYRDADVKRNLVAQITHSVKWLESVRYLMGKGEMEFLETGPGDVLTKLVQKIKMEAEPLFVVDAEETVETSEVDARSVEPEPEAVVDEAPLSLGVAPVTEQAPAPSLCKDEDVKGAKEGSACEGITPFTLGNAGFRKDYNLSYAYLAGSMYRGISSKEMVVRLGRSGVMGFLGAGGVRLDELEEAILFIRRELGNGEPYGVNLLHNLNDLQKEEQTVDLLLKYGVTIVEASAFLSITPALVRYRAHGLRRGHDGVVSTTGRIIAKVSRPEIAELFLSPAPERLIGKLIDEKRITGAQAELLAEIPMADDICVEADSGGHTDAGIAYVLMPAMLELRDEMMKKHRFRKPIRVGAAGGIGTPEAAAAAFILGADFVLTGSINQCTVEARTSDAVKDRLQQLNVQDTEYAPAGDMFELGAKVQVLKKGSFFPARANRLYELYRQHDSLDGIDEKTKKQLEERYFRRSFDGIYEEIISSCSPQEKALLERSPKKKMALVFKWYFKNSTRLALEGVPGQEIDYQVPCGPALGAFNQWVKGTPLEPWRNRHVDEIAVKLMAETATLLSERFQSLGGRGSV